MIHSWLNLSMWNHRYGGTAVTKEYMEGQLCGGWAPLTPIPPTLMFKHQLYTKHGIVMKSGHRDFKGTLPAASRKIFFPFQKGTEGRDTSFLLFLWILLHLKYDA